MIIGPRYKIARRLGVPVFEKTQTQKFATRTGARTPVRSRAKSDYGLGMLEKQKARLSYGVPGRQFTNYVKNALAERGNSGEHLIRSLESRLDNAVLRSGYATTRQAARQMVSHGHLTINGKIVTIPSYRLSVGDVIGIREGSKKKVLFDKKEVTVDGIPTANASELMFNVASVLEFYSR